MERTIHVLNELKREQIVMEYAIGDAIAALFYVEPFETHDLDVFITPAPTESRLVSLEALYAYLARKGHEVGGEGVTIEGIPVQFLVPGSALEEEALEEARASTYGAESVRIMTPEHLLAIMIHLNRPKDRVRIAIFLEQCEIDRQRLSSILKRFGLQEKWARALREMNIEGDRS